MISRFLVSVGLLASALTVASGSPVLAAAPSSCTDVSVAVSTFKRGGIPLLDWRENLAFDGEGTMWVSHIMKNQVEAYGPDGKLKLTVAVPGPGGIRRGPDGLMYVNSGTTPIVGSGQLMRFDPAAANPVAETFVSGLNGINGLAIDADGNFYFGREFSAEILKIRPDGSADSAWSAAADARGTNGVVIVDGELFATQTLTLLSTIVRVPLDDPAAHSVLAETSPLLSLPNGLDDLEPFGDDLVAAGFLSGNLIRVDRTTGDACVLARGLLTPTSVRRPVGFGSHDPAKELFVTEASGRIMKVTVTPS